MFHLPNLVGHHTLAIMSDNRDQVEPEKPGNSSNNDAADFTGKLLIAMPGMGDPRFEKSVILICSHSDKGAMGLIVNKPAEDVSFPDLLTQLEIDSGETTNSPMICFGGPVEGARGFVLHTTDYRQEESTIDVPGGFAMTATIDILQDIAKGAGPKRALLALGYSGWSPGQLEDEITRNGWLTCDADMDLVFADDDVGKWTNALSLMGIDAIALSSTAGRA